MEMPSKLRTLIKPGKSMTITFHQSVPVPPADPAVIKLAIEIITLQAWIETFRAMVFLKILKTSAVSSAEAWDEFIMASKKAEFINKEIKPLLSARGYSVLSAVFELADRAANRRNILAHTLWGSIAEFPNKLLTFDPRLFVKAHAPAIEKLAKGTVTEQDGVDKQKVFIDNADVYTEADLEAMIRELKFVLSKLEYLNMGMEGPEFLREPMYSTLASEPAIQAILEREQRKASQGAQTTSGQSDDEDGKA